MSVVSKEDIKNSVMATVKSQSDDDLAKLLEDIDDSFSVDDAIAADRDMWKAKAEDYRTRYINRFYGGYDKDNSRGYVNSSVEQEALEKDEDDVDFEDLFE